ncbi:MAG: hypothetical protein WCI03_02575 [bacterium]
MSLIEEALRKQREENDKSGNASISPPPIPDVSPESTPEPPANAEEPARRPWVLLAGIVGGGVLAILFVLWLLFYGLGLWHNKPGTLIVKSVGPTNTPISIVSNLSVGATNNTTLLAVPPPVSSTTTVAQLLTPHPTQTALTPPQTSQPKPPPVAAPVIPASPLSIAEPPPLPQKIAPPPPTPAKLEMPVVWPKLTVSGIIGSSKNGRSAVILNGQMMSPGETIEGVVIDSIDKQKVKLKFSGEVKLLSVGATTE